MKAQSLSVLDIVKAMTTPPKLKLHCSVISSNCTNKRRSLRMITSTWDQLALAIQECMVCRKFTSSQSHLDRFSRCLALSGLLSLSGCVTSWSLSSTSMEHTACKTALLSVTRLEKKNCRLMDTCLFDVVGLFTNVPLQEVIDICARAIYHDDNIEKQPTSLSEKTFRDLLQKVTSGVEFSFNNVMYR